MLVLGIGVKERVVVRDGVGNTGGVCVLLENVFESEYVFTSVAWLVVLRSVGVDVGGG